MAETVGANGHREPVPQEPRRELRVAAAATAPAVVKKPQDELEVLIRARYPIIYVVTWEEERLEQRLQEIAKKRNKTLHVWTCSQGLVKFGAEPQRGKTGGATRATRSRASTPCSLTSTRRSSCSRTSTTTSTSASARATSGTSAGSATSPTRFATRTRRLCSSPR